MVGLCLSEEQLDDDFDLETALEMVFGDYDEEEPDDIDDCPAAEEPSQPLQDAAQADLIAPPSAQLALTLHGMITCMRHVQA